ncbi:hypothetical protein [Amycolatopsis regifaucium]|uniref:Uncharacterized protein n=1 Tax=Amycolatopsis regifaucium TaxID=546365 RepID=A0A154MMA6_9PSEU|nr:hypothetical protein [Amycolatopsis regifaucium]KZB85385.1 hypothetical protein AVL48_30995 [Amycolatopsis regifaucium]OKA09007.1 hypothetical protein ATP06_0209800 [Amycolatopsis regifaucium]SFJ38823.1 hypothetical protein SAMN04489731_12044 [Amycolatopsis regifaucium]
MSDLTYTIIEAIPRVLLLVVGVLGLIFSIKRRAKGVSGLMVGAFVVMLVATAASIVWQFVVSNVSSWVASGQLSGDELRLIFMGVGVPLDAAALLSWLLVAIAVLKSGRPSRQPGVAPHPGAVNYPMAAQPGFPNPRPGHIQPGHPPDQHPEAR